MTKVIAWVKSNPLFAVVIVIAVIIVLVWFKDAIGGQVERFNRWRFDKAIAAEKAQVDKLKAENQKLLEDAKTAYALGKAKELERDALYAELEKYGTAAKDAIEKQKKAAKDYETDLKDIAVDVSLLDRCLQYCGSRLEIGYPCKPSASEYCRVRYSGR